MEDNRDEKLGQRSRLKSARTSSGATALAFHQTEAEEPSRYVAIPTLQAGNACCCNITTAEQFPWVGMAALTLLHLFVLSCFWNLLRTLDLAKSIAVGMQSFFSNIIDSRAVLCACLFALISAVTSAVTFALPWFRASMQLEAAKAKEEKKEKKLADAKKA